MNRSRSHRTLESILALVLLVLAIRHSPRSQTAAAEEPPPAPPPFVEKVTSELVLIDAHVTDLQGRPVSGLVRDDFILKIDGKVKPAASFEFKSLDDLPRTSAAGPQRDASTAPGTPAVLPRRFVLFFEDALSSAPGLTAARHAADELLRRGFERTDQVALFSFDRRLRMLQDFTIDRDALRAALRDNLQDVTRVKSSMDRNLVDEEILEVLGNPMVIELKGGPAAAALAPQAAPAGSDDEEKRARAAVVLAQSAGLIEETRTHAVFNALRGVADSLSPWPGYKAIMLMGDGFSENPAWEPFDRIDDGSAPPRVISIVRKYAAKIYDSVRSRNLRLDIKNFVQDMTASGVTVHTIQTSGLIAGAPGRSLAASSRGNSLKAIASNTGGVTSALNDPLKGLEQAERSARAYYVLGHAPEGERDGRFHAISVELTRQAAKRGARVTARRGFVLLKPADAYARTIQAAYTVPEMFHGVEFDLSVILGPASRSERTVDAVLHVPEGQVLFLSRGGPETADLEVGLVAIGEGESETFRLSRHLQVSRPRLAGAEGSRGLDLFVRFVLPRSPQTLSAVISDRSSGSTGGARVALVAGADSTPSVVGLSLYSLNESSLWGDLQNADHSPSLTTRGPALKSVFRVGEAIAVGYRPEPNASGASPPIVEIHRGDDLIRAIKPEAGTRSSGDAPIRVTLPLDGLGPGEYLLVVRDPGRTKDLPATLRFRIVPEA